MSGMMTSAEAPVCRVRLEQPREARQSSTGAERTADTSESNWKTEIEVEKSSYVLLLWFQQ